MRLDDQRPSSNVEDRRGGGGGGGPMIGSLGLGGILLLVVFAVLFRVNPLDLISNVPTTSSQPAASGAPSDTAGDFSARVLGSTEDVWSKLFSEQKVAGAPALYAPPTLVLYSGVVQSGCGGASAAMGPFYCPNDQKLYLDTSFFDELSNRFGAPGDFAQAYVIAHEVGHHIQRLTGTSDKAAQAQRTMGKTQYNAFSVKMELQADCYAGVWGHYADEWKNQLQPGDIEEALKAASQIGDDRLQKQSQGTIVPDSFTHGTSEQRVRWFKKGFDGGDAAQCDTFGAKSL